MIAVQAIITKLKPSRVVGDTTGQIKDVAIFSEENLSSEIISWVSEKNKGSLYKCVAGVVICPDTIDESRLSSNCTYLLFKSPRTAFKELLENFFVKMRPKATISATVTLGSNVQIGINVFIGNNTVIEDDVEIGNNVIIYHNNAILSGTKIGNNVLIGSNNTIGGVGFGYEKDESGTYQVIPHIGGVIIEENVEIGNNTCIDRAVLGNTLLKKSCKIDNLVHIAHGVIVGENSLVIAHAMIGGSTIIGDNVWVAPNSSLINKITIGDNATIGLGAVVVQNVNSGDIVVGNPAKPLQKK